VIESVCRKMRLKLEERRKTKRSNGQEVKESDYAGPGFRIVPLFTVVAGLIARWQNPCFSKASFGSAKQLRLLPFCFFLKNVEGKR